MARVTAVDGQLIVPDVVSVPFIAGDGIGAEITPVTQAVVDAALAASGSTKRIEWIEVLAGEKAFNETGTWLPDATLAAFQEYLVGIKGPLMTPVGGGMRSLNVALRQQLDLFACVRPVRWFAGVESPVKEPWKVDMVIFRENTEDVYAGIEWEQGSPEAAKLGAFLREELGVTKVRFPETSAYGIKPISIQGTERLVRSAVDYALSSGRNRLTLVHKGNIMKFTEGGFRKWAYELIEREYGSTPLVVDDVIADAFLQNALLKPEAYSVIATCNLNGDYISDQLAAQVGGIGIAPGANINYLTGHAIFEATHGTAPDIAGQDKANPSSLLLSAVMLLEHLGLTDAATRITTAMESLFGVGKATGDLARFMPNGQPLGTRAFGDALIAELG
jgi:isocitrate dehydrogenase